MAYKIKSGDTLSEIAEKNNTSVAEIMASNPQISNANQIQAGASLNLSSAGSGASTYQGGFGTESGGSSQERARAIIGDDRASELAKLSQQNFTPAEAQQASRQYGYVGGVGSLDQNMLTQMSQTKYDPFNTKDTVIGGLLGAVIPGAGLLYTASKYNEAYEDRKIANQLMQQGQYENKGLFGTGLFKGENADQFVPVYDENDQLVGSLGLDAEGNPMRYTGDRMQGYEGLGSDLIQPREMPQMGGDDNDGPAPISAEAVGVTPDAPAAPPYRGPAKLPQIPLPSALDQGTPRPAPQQPLTRPTPIPAGFGQQKASVPLPQGGQGVMSTLAAQQQQEQYPFMYGNEYQRQEQRGMV
jgi:LysM repeat protein